MDAFEREIGALVDEMKSPKQRSAMLARFARDEIAAVKRDNERAIGRSIRPPAVTVDGRAGAPLSSVTPDGTIIATFNVETASVLWILHELETISPKLTGAYRRSHVVFADGIELDLPFPKGAVPDAREFVIVSDLAYAMKLDPKDGLPARSKQARKGVYSAIAAVARRRFADEAEIRFTFRDVPLRKGGVTRNPAIIVRPL